MANQYALCTVPRCRKFRQHKNGAYCAMHLARYRRNGTIQTQKEMGIIYNMKLGKLTNKHINFIKKRSSILTDKKNASALGVPYHLIRYARRKIMGRKYKGLNTRNYLKLKYKKTKNNTCEVCGWNEAPCDVHHKIPLHKGGKDNIENFICLCPNHHRLFHMRFSAHGNV